jgi:hypothetical protein
MNAMNLWLKDKLRRNSLSRLIGAGGRLLHPSLLAVLGRDLLGLSAAPKDSARHLDAAMAWLCRAQDHGVGGGVSAG